MTVGGQICIFCLGIGGFFFFFSAAAGERCPPDCGNSVDIV